ncbi:TPA: helix-turn-helix domain-containing protein, partial [Klebsiella pneumoniae]
MSIDAMRWAKKVKTGKSSAKAVLTWMADMCGADLCAFPSIPALAEATELDKKTVQSSLQYLVSIGLIEDTGERRGKTKQIPVYRLLGVEESVAEIEHTQKREHYQKRDRLNIPENGVVTAEKAPENGTVSCTQNNQTIPFFPSNDPKNGIRNLPEESKDITPTHKVLVEPVVPDYPNQPGIVPGETQAFGKFAMYFGWKPSEDFPRLATIWGMPLRPGINLTAELSSFIAYWQAEG